MCERDLLVPTLSNFTRTILGSYDISAVLEDLSESATRVLSLAGSGVSLIHEGRLVYATCIPSHLIALEQAQEKMQAGPCVEAFRSRAVVAVPDLSVRAREWGAYCEAGADVGVLAVAGIPMQLGDVMVGALNLYSGALRQWSDEDLAVAQVLADMATGYLINASQTSKQQQVNEQLQHALESRVILEQAKGMVAASHNVSVEAAFKLIRGHARSRNDSLRGVAEGVVNLDLRIEPGQAPPARNHDSHTEAKQRQDRKPLPGTGVLTQSVDRGLDTNTSTSSAATSSAPPNSPTANCDFSESPTRQPTESHPPPRFTSGH